MDQLKGGHENLICSDFSNLNKSDSIENIDQGPPINYSIDHLGVRKKGDVQSCDDLRPIADFLNNVGKEKEENEYIYVPEKILQSNSSWCFDIITGNDKRSACFTSSYGKFVRGTGSVIYLGKIKSDEMQLENGDDKTMHNFLLVSPEKRQFDSNWNGMDLNGKLRYFTGTEMAQLMGFPIKERMAQNSFSFPSNCTPKQQWRLMGNSLNVKVASKLIELSLRICYGR